MILRIAILFDSAVVGMVYPADGLSSVSDVLVFVGECLSGVQVSGPCPSISGGILRFRFRNDLFLVRRRCSCFDFLRDWVGVQCIACVAYAKRTSKGLSCAKAYFRERLTTRIRFLAGYKIEKNALDGCPGIEKEGRFQRRKAMGRYRL
ncbi:uncharacterized protein DS421_7g209250 [Arachis hypogaea]|nr:uncharacterized protein DS421_7g209250 [Arachis hypogaea]